MDEIEVGVLVCIVEVVFAIREIAGYIHAVVVALNGLGVGKPKAVAQGKGTAALHRNGGCTRQVAYIIRSRQLLIIYSESGLVTYNYRAGQTFRVRSVSHVVHFQYTLAVCCTVLLQRERNALLNKELGNLSLVQLLRDSDVATRGNKAEGVVCSHIYANRATLLSMATRYLVYPSSRL